MYQSLYDLINTYVFSNSIVSGSYVDLVCTLASTVGVFALVCIPFAIVYWICKKIVGGF